MRNAFIRRISILGFLLIISCRTAGDKTSSLATNTVLTEWKETGRFQCEDGAYNYWFVLPDGKLKFVKFKTSAVHELFEQTLVNAKGESVVLTQDHTGSVYSIAGLKASKPDKLGRVKLSGQNLMFVAEDVAMEFPLESASFTLYPPSSDSSAEKDLDKFGGIEWEFTQAGNSVKGIGYCNKH